MKYLKLDLNNVKSTELNQVVDSLQRGEVIVIPTDTIYGLSCLASNRSAIRKIYSLKKRETRKPLLILVSSLSMLKKYTYLSKQQNILWHQVCTSSSPATSVILTSRQILPLELEAGTKALAVRLPKSVFLIKIIRRLKEPLVSTSFNISGRQSINDLKNVDHYFSGQIQFLDLIVDAGKSKEQRSSRLIDLRGEEMKIIRK